MALQKNQHVLNRDTNRKQETAICEKAVERSEWRDFSEPEEKKFSLPTFKELKNLIAFLLLNIFALLLLDLYPTPSAELRSLLGMSPPLLWINIACSIYLFTELVLVLCRERQSNSSFSSPRCTFSTGMLVPCINTLRCFWGSELRYSCLKHSLVKTAVNLYRLTSDN